MAEWFKAAILKTAEQDAPGVRIPFSPPGRQTGQKTKSQDAQTQT